MSLFLVQFARWNLRKSFVFFRNFDGNLRCDEWCKDVCLYIIKTFPLPRNFLVKFVSAVDFNCYIKIYRILISPFFLFFFFFRLSFTFYLCCAWQYSALSNLNSIEVRASCWSCRERDKKWERKLIKISFFYATNLHINNLHKFIFCGHSKII